jgi:hypothetical protein
VESVAAAVIVAVYSVFVARETAGLKVATVPEQETTPAMGVPPGPARLNVVAGDASVAQFIVLLKVARRTWVIGTPVAPFRGDVAITAGRVAVVKLHT